MNLAIPITGLPVPAVKGGAIQTGIQHIIDQNEKYGLLRITVISIFNKEALEASKNYKNTEFVFIHSNSLLRKIVSYANSIFYKFKLDLRLMKEAHFLRKVVQIINTHNFDFILLKNNVQYVLPLAKRTRTHICLQLHNDHLNSSVFKAIDICNVTRKILVNSAYIKSRVLSIQGVQPDKIYVNKNCTDIEIFNKELYKNDVDTYKKKLGIKNNEIVIIYCGRIIPAKGVKELIAAVKLLNANINYKLIIVGSSWFGKSTKSKYILELEELSKEIEDKIIFTGYISYRDVPKYHAISDIAVVPSIWEEPAGRVVIEFQSSGLPLIVSDSGGISDYISYESAMVVSRDGNFSTKLAKALEVLTKNTDLRKRMGNYGKEFAKNFSPNKYYFDLINILTNDNE